MSEYTPTTDEIRISTVADLSSEDYLYRHRLDSFDRWLAAHDAQVRADTAERIARDIEQELYDHEGECPEGSCEECDLIFAAAEVARSYPERIAARVGRGEEG